ncbi:MAG: acetate--CoA ligase family protein, partial [Amphritea sp.]|nr:acetate--CoA ligase family protein [Amphritea sp.]
GPNCYGLLNFTNGIALWPDRLTGQKHSRGVAIVSQSGNLALNLIMEQRSIPINHLISVGNQAVMEIGDYIEPLLEDESVSAIGFYVEGLKDVEGFSRAALKALKKGIPLVMLKAGVSELGTQLTMSHTSSLAGSDDMYQAMFDRLGIMRVSSQAELLETLKLAAICDPPPSNRVGVLTCSGADSAIFADGLDARGLTLPELVQSQHETLRPILPGFVTLCNPLDYNTSIWGDLENCTQVFGTMMDGDSDTNILALDFPKPGAGSDREWQIAVDAMIAAHKLRSKTTIVMSNLSELIPEDARQRMVAAGVAPMQGAEEGLSALASLVKFGQRRREIQAMEDPEQLLLRQAELLDGNDRMLDEWDSKQLLASYGLPLPGGQVAELSEVAIAADSVGYPVVMKGVSDKLAHKTEAGAVALNLNSGEEVTAAAEKMAASLTGQGLEE